jgi:hypothetical protein
VALCLSFAGLPAPAVAQNLLVNPNFDADLSSWELAPATTFDGTRGSPATGSALFAATLAVFDIDDLIVVDQCVDGIVPGSTYTFGGELLLTAVPAGGVAGVFVSWSGTPCGGAVSDLGVEVGPSVSTTGAFVGTTWSAVAPAGAASVDVGVITGVAAVPPGPVGPGDTVFVPGTYEVNADTLSFEASVPVPTMGPLWFVMLTGALVLAATKALRSVSRGNA